MLVLLRLLPLLFRPSHPKNAADEFLDRATLAGIVCRRPSRGARWYLDLGIVRRSGTLGVDGDGGIAVGHRDTSRRAGARY